MVCKLLQLVKNNYEKLFGFDLIQHLFSTIKYFFTVINAGYDIFCHNIRKVVYAFIYILIYFFKSCVSPNNAQTESQFGTAYE